MPKKEQLIKKLLYENYPKIMNQKNEFYIHGNLINKNKNLKDNNIMNNDIITFEIYKNND